MTKLDEIALNVELVLISIIEAVALTFLADNAIRVLQGPDPLHYLPYIFAGLTILLVFWSQAILHAISFIRWPLRMEHMLLYFFAVFVQVIAYSEIDNVVAWFFVWTIFSLLALLIYVVDLWIIRGMRPYFAVRPGGSEFIHEVERRHVIELQYLVPSALAFNVVALALTHFEPQLFGSGLPFAALGTMQFLISVGALVDCVRNFKERSAMLPGIFN